MSNFKPLEILFVKQYITEGTLKVEVVTDMDTKQKLLDLFDVKVEE